MSKIQSGQYRLLNVKYGTMVCLQDGTGALSARRGKVDGTVQWTVTDVSVEQFIFQNVEYSSFAWVPPQSRQDDELKGHSSVRRKFNVREAGRGKYIIYTTDSDLCWGLDSEDDGAPLVLSDETNDLRNQWKFEPALAQAVSHARQASMFTTSRSSDAPSGGNTSLSGKLKTGRYILTNVQSGNSAVLPDPNSGTHLCANTIDKGSEDGLWDVTLESNGRFLIKNVHHGMCAWVDDRASENAEIMGWAPERRRLYKIEETTKGRYVISTTDTKLYWGVADLEVGTPICLYKGPPGARAKQWKLIPYREGGATDAGAEETPAARSGEQEIADNRQRAEDDPSNRAALAKSLQDQATHLTEMDKDEDAMRVSQEAIDIRRQLADQDPSVLPDLASSLHDLAGYQYILDHDDDAVRNITEAVKIRRDLCATNPQYLSALAESLSDQADYMYNTDCESSVRAIQSSINIRQVLVRDDPEKLSDLADSYESLSGYQAELDRPREAVNSTQKAIEIRRRLVAEDESLLPELAENLDGQAEALVDLKDYQGGASCLAEAVQIRRQLADTDSSLLSELARSLHNHADSLDKSGNVREALSVIGEAVKVRRKLLAEDWEDRECNYELAFSLRDNAEYVDKLGDHRKAAGIVEEAIELLRKLPDDDPSIRGELAEYIQDAAGYQAKLGKYRDAIRMTDEAIDILRQIHNDSTLPDLATSLHNRATYLAEMDDYGEAVDSVKEACDIRQKLKRDDETLIPDLEASKLLLASYQRKAKSRPGYKGTQKGKGEQRSQSNGDDVNDEYAPGDEGYSGQNDDAGSESGSPTYSTPVKSSSNKRGVYSHQGEKRSGRNAEGSDDDRNSYGGDNREHNDDEVSEPASPVHTSAANKHGGCGSPRRQRSDNEGNASDDEGVRNRGGGVERDDDEGSEPSSPVHASYGNKRGGYASPKRQRSDDDDAQNGGGRPERGDDEGSEPSSPVYASSANKRGPHSPQQQRSRRSSNGSDDNGVPDYGRYRESEQDNDEGSEPANTRGGYESPTRQRSDNEAEGSDNGHNSNSDDEQSNRYSRRRYV